MTYSKNLNKIDTITVIRKNSTKYAFLLGTWEVFYLNILLSTTFSTFLLQPDTAVVDCIYWSQGNQFLIQASYNVRKGHNNTVLKDVRKMLTCMLRKASNLSSLTSACIFTTNAFPFQPTLGLVNGSSRGSYKDNILSCSFTKYKEVNASLPDAFKVGNLTKEYYVLLGIGPADSKGAYEIRD